MPVSLSIIRGKHEGLTFDLRGESRAVIGRAPQATITLDDTLLSRKHCRIEFTEDAVLLIDLNSTNGTYVNKKRVETEEMSPKDFFQAGSNLFQIQSTPRQAPPAENSYLCPRCRKEITLDDSDSTEEKACPHCGRPAFPGKEVIGIYEVLEIIGKGSTGLVYKVKDLKTDRTLALKTVRLEGEIDAKTISRYLRVSHTEGRLFHPNIVQVHRTGKANGFFTIAMEYVEGITLYQKICEEERIELKEALSITKQVANALVHASEKGVVHRDVKPENILVAHDLTVKLMDFSIAKRFRPQVEAPVTLAGEGLGTIYYVPPEQIYNAANVDGRADVYALGCTLYHMVTGRPPFKDSKDRGRKKGALIRILAGDYRPIVEYAPAVEGPVAEMISKAMAREADRRFQSPSEFLEELEFLTDDSESST
ncbi:MAG: protein kinase [Planctomycetota bacterium]|nr:protein kinase [Planctomycetota bacterium]